MRSADTDAVIVAAGLTVIGLFVMAMHPRKTFDLIVRGRNWWG